MKIEPETRAHAENLLRFIDASPSPWHAVEMVKRSLEENSFSELKESDSWSLGPGGRHYVVRDGSSIIAFVTGDQAPTKTGYRIIGAHTDSPGLRIKPNPVSQSGGMNRIGVEVYGGPILVTFTDRDLSLAGRVAIMDGGGRFSTRLIHIDKPLLRLPNLAIHMNRKVNEKGLLLHIQNELPLILSNSNGEDNNGKDFLNLLARQVDTNIDSITAWDLAIFDTQRGTLYGPDDEFLANSQLDNLASCHAALTALLSEESLEGETTRVCAFFDHEEIGSESLKGADSSFLPDVLERISLARDQTREAYKRALATSFLISADMAHAYQPNFASAYEPDHRVRVNHGPVIKINANQRYTSESISDSRFIQLCSEAGVPWQKYNHRSNLPCGSTIGPITSAKLGIRSVDVGCPMWAMHSIRESAGVLDHEYMTRAMTRFFTQEI